MKNTPMKSPKFGDPIWYYAVEHLPEQYAEKGVLNALRRRSAHRSRPPIRNALVHQIAVLWIPALKQDAAGHRLALRISSIARFAVLWAYPG
jgi:hypothetical protein